MHIAKNIELLEIADRETNERHCLLAELTNPNLEAWETQIIINRLELQEMYLGYVMGQIRAEGLIC